MEAHPVYDDRSDLAKTLSKTAMAEAIARIRTTPFDPDKHVPSSVASPTSTLFVPADDPESPVPEAVAKGAAATPVVGYHRQLAITCCIVISSFVQVCFWIW